MGEKGSLELAPDRDQLIPGSSYGLARDETSCTDLRSTVLTHPFTIAVCDWSKCHHVRTRIKRSQASLGSNVKVVTSQIKFNGNDV